MRAGIIQSNYLPWRGYFDFIDDVDVFVFYDDVQYTDKDWRNRNRIKTPSGLLWLSVPVQHTRQSLIQTAAIRSDTRWAEKHIRSLQCAYQKAPFYADYADHLFAMLRENHATISDLNITLCQWIMQQLNIHTAVRRSSEFQATGDKFERPLKLLLELGATAYLSGPAARPYLDAAQYQAAGITVDYKTYDYSAYPQLWGAFEGSVSVLDLLFNTGPEARRYLKSLSPAQPAL